MDTQAQFHEWLARALPSETPDGIIAYNINLSERPSTFVAEICGAAVFDRDDPDWACDESWTCRPSEFEFPRSDYDDWQGALSAAVAWTTSFMSAEHTSILRQAQAVAIGFVDGDLEYITS